jgi:hypothetical protein
LFEASERLEFTLLTLINDFEEELRMSSDDGGDRLYSSGEIALAMILASLSIILPVLAGTVYYLGWL